MNTPNHHRADALQQQYARQITQRLSTGMGDMPYDISERLRASRMQALAKRKVVASVKRTAPASVVVSMGSAAALGRGSEGGSWWNAVVSAVPLLALVVGLVVINTAQDERSANDVAEVDSALLTDDLPPAAYADPGFVQFLKTSAHSN